MKPLSKKYQREYATVRIVGFKPQKNKRTGEPMDALGWFKGATRWMKHARAAELPDYYPGFLWLIHHRAADTNSALVEVDLTMMARRNNIRLTSAKQVINFFVEVGAIKIDSAPNSVLNGEFFASNSELTGKDLSPNPLKSQQTATKMSAPVGAINAVFEEKGQKTGFFDLPATPNSEQIGGYFGANSDLTGNDLSPNPSELLKTDAKKAVPDKRREEKKRKEEEKELKGPQLPLSPPERTSLQPTEQAIKNAPRQKDRVTKCEANSEPERSYATARVIGCYVLAWQQRWGKKSRPHIDGKAQGIIKRMLKTVDEQRLCELVQVFCQMPGERDWYAIKRHDLATLEANLSDVGLALDNGEPMATKKTGLQEWLDEQSQKRLGVAQ